VPPQHPPWLDITSASLRQVAGWNGKTARKSLLCLRDYGVHGGERQTVVAVAYAISPEEEKVSLFLS